MQDPWEDKSLMNEFCYKYADDFDYFIADKFSEDPRFVNKEYYEEDYCEANSGSFLDFAANYYEDQKFVEGDRKNDESK